MTEDQAFLKAIAERPDDDSPRLIYADWLEEHGQAERAEFIRVQCALARYPQPPRLFSDADAFSFRNRVGIIVVKGGDVVVGERIDVRLSEEELRTNERPNLKADWHGLLVTEVILIGGGNRMISFQVDKESVPWPGQALQKRSEELLMGTGEKCNQNALVFSDCQDWQLAGWDPPHTAYLQRPYNKERTNIEVYRLRFCRGFVDWVSTTCLGWHKQGARLIRAVPMVQEVVLTDKEPYVNPYNNNHWVWTHESIEETARHTLPSPIFFYLNGRSGLSLSTRYESKEEALQDLNQACLSCAKRLIE